MNGLNKWLRTPAGILQDDAIDLLWRHPNRAQIGNQLPGCRGDAASASVNQDQVCAELLAV